MDGWLGSLHRMLGEGHFIGALRLCSWMTAHGMDSLTVATTTIARYITVTHQHNEMYDTCLPSWDVPSALVFLVHPSQRTTSTATTTTTISRSL